MVDYRNTLDEFINEWVSMVYSGDLPTEKALEEVSLDMGLNDEVASNEWKENIAPEMRICGNITMAHKDYTVALVKTTAGAELRFYDDKEISEKCGIDAEKCLYQPTSWMGWKSPKAMGVYPVGVLRAFNDNGGLLGSYGFGRFYEKQFILSPEFSSIIFDLAKHWHCETI